MNKKYQIKFIDIVEATYEFEAEESLCEEYLRSNLLDFKPVLVKEEVVKSLNEPKIKELV